MTMFKKLHMTAAVLALSTTAVAAQEVEVLHWWTSGGEAAAVGTLRDALADGGVGWVDMPVAGGGGSDAMTVLRARVTAGDPPTAVQMLGFSIQDWAAEGALANLDDLAAEQGWADVVPAALQRFSTYDGHWVAAPVNVHSTNWVWANTALMEELGIEQPTSWDEFVAAMQAAQDAGYTALAHGGQAWQDATIFDSMVMGVGGPDFYQASMVDLDPEALGSDMMVEAFQRMETLRGFVDDNFSGRDWNLASAMVINGEALFQIMGDWAKGEFVNAGQTAGEEFTCFRVPGTEGTVTFNSDQFAMFNVTDEPRGSAARHGLGRHEPGVPDHLQPREGLGARRAPTSPPTSSTCADRWAWRNWPKRRPAAACSARWPMATPTRRRCRTRCMT
jgi:glucose/mannose transport system substrate-binding protein